MHKKQKKYIVSESSENTMEITQEEHMAVEVAKKEKTGSTVSPLSKVGAEAKKCGKKDLVCTICAQGQR